MEEAGRRSAPRLHSDTRIDKLALELIPFRSQEPRPGLLSQLSQL